MRPVAHCIGAIISGLVAVVMFPGRIVAETDPVLKRHAFWQKRARELGRSLSWKQGLASNGLEIWTAAHGDSWFSIVKDSIGSFDFRVAGVPSDPSGSWSNIKTLREAMDKAGDWLMWRERRIDGDMVRSAHEEATNEAIEELPPLEQDIRRIGIVTWPVVVIVIGGCLALMGFVIWKGLTSGI